jgi:DNA-directed RNA polymerase subunit RPC12/RpoP
MDRIYPIENMYEYRCWNCGKLLVEKATVGLEIRCTRCRTRNVVTKQDLE